MEIQTFFPSDIRLCHRDLRSAVAGVIVEVPADRIGQETWGTGGGLASQDGTRGGPYGHLRRASAQAG
jgi:hypothetical protein